MIDNVTESHTYNRKAAEHMLCGLRSFVYRKYFFPENPPPGVTMAAQMRYTVVQRENKKGEIHESYPGTSETEQKK